MPRPSLYGRRSDRALPDRPAGPIAPPTPSLARLAAIVTLVNVPVHVVWALGGTLLLPGGEAVATLPGIRVANAVVSLVLVLGAAVLLLIGGPWSRPVPGRPAFRGGGRVLPGLLLLAIGTGAAVCVSHGAYGLVSKGLFLAGHDVVQFPDLGNGWSAAQKHSAAVLDVALFEPWFLLEGVALALAGWQYLRTKRGRRRWIVAVCAGTVVLLGFGVLLTVTGSRVAIT